MTTINQRAIGACFCGNVNFSVQLPVKWCAHCHCTMCRRIHGAAFVTWFGVNDGEHRIDERDVIWYQSSADAERGRCRHCATPMFFRSKRWPGELHIALATMKAPIDLKPQCHVFYADAVDWLEWHDELPRYATVASEG